jgi:hypothetical protein
MRQYSIDHVECNWFGLDLKPGLAQGTSITEARTTPSWTNKATGLGKVVRVYNPDRSGTLSIVVDQESATHQDLRALALTDRISRNVVGPLVVVDSSSAEVFYYKNSYIATEPDESRGSESTTFTWTFNFESVSHVSTDSSANIVGS